MRILFAVSKLKNGGAERVVALLANKLVSAGYEVGILTIEGDEVAYQIDPKIDYMPVVIGGNRYTRRIKRIFRARNAFKKFKPDIILSFLDRICFTTIPANFGLKNKLVVVVRNDPRNNDMSQGIKKHIRSFLFPKANYFVFQTTDERDYFSDNIRKNSAVIKNPISESMPEPLKNKNRSITNVFRSMNRTDLRLKSGMFYVPVQVVMIIIGTLSQDITILAAFVTVSFAFRYLFEFYYLIRIGFGNSMSEFFRENLPLYCIFALCVIIAGIIETIINVENIIFSLIIKMFLLTAVYLLLLILFKQVHILIDLIPERVKCKFKRK